MEIKLRTFESQIHYFNGMYKLPVAPYPTTFEVIKNENAKLLAKDITPLSDVGAVYNRLQAFMKTVEEELHEGSEILKWLQLGKRPQREQKEGEVTWIDYTEIEFLTDIADWLGDIQVYCASEMVKYGLPVNDILRIIMSSNFSKLGADGKPIYNEQGKVLKGPMYWKPEPQIRALLDQQIQDANVKEDHGIVWSSGK